MRLTPRPYQQEAIDNIKRALAGGLNRLLVQMGTGLGKTSGVVSNLPHQMPEQFEYVGDHGGMLFLSHRREILMHAYEKVKAAYPDRTCGIEMGEYHCMGYEDFIFASVASIGREMGNRINKFQHRFFGTVICDEGHHVTEDGMWDNILKYFNLDAEAPDDFELPDGRKPLLLFLTATPDRDDDKSIAPFLQYAFDEHYGAVFSYSLRDGVKDGWLTDIVCEPALPETDMKDLSADVAGGFVARLAATVTEGHKTLLFAKNVEQSGITAQVLREEYDLTAFHVDHRTDKDERDRFMSQFIDSDSAFMSNRLIYTEGTDIPGLTAIVDSAPTKNKSLFLQKIGRGVRPHPDAQVDKYDTAAERRKAIKDSPKPHLLYVPTFLPGEEAIGMVEAFTGLQINDEDQTHGLPVFEEVVDVIEVAEEEQPERDISSFHEAKEIAWKGYDYDIWSQTIHNERLRRVSDNRWIDDGESISIWLPENPRCESRLEDTPVVWTISGDRFREIIVGGWSQSAGHPVPSKVKTDSKISGTIESTIRSLDRFLDRHRISDKVRIGSDERAPTKKDLDYIRRRMDGTGKVKTDRTAKYLKDFVRIKKKLQEVQ